VEESGGLRPGQVSKQRINARLSSKASKHTRQCPWVATQPESSKVRGEVSVITMGQGLAPKSPSIGYAPSEYQKKRWPRQARIEGWFPLIGKEQNHSNHTYDVITGSQQGSGEQKCFDDDTDATTEVLMRSAREDLKITRLSGASALNQRCVLCDVAQKREADAVRSKTQKVRWRDRSVLDRIFDKSPH
jgi:hypothetical protein